MSTIKFAGWLIPVAVMAFSSTGSTEVHGGEMLLQGEWRFAMDRSDVGDEERWFNRELSDRIQLPGILQAQGYGDEIGIHTPWVLSLYDHYWYLREDFQSYTNKGNVRVPFVSQPERQYVVLAW